MLIGANDRAIRHQPFENDILTWSVSRTFLRIYSMPEVVSAFGFGDFFERAADAVLETVDGALGSASYQCFQPGEGVLDWVQVRCAGRQIAELGVGGFKDFTDAFGFVGGRLSITTMSQRLRVDALT